MNLVDVIYMFFAALVLYFSFLFMLLYLKNRHIAEKIPKISRLPPVSIVVPAHNEQDTIGETLDNLKKLEYPKNKLEIIVVDDGSTDKTADIAKKFGVRVIKKKNGGKASALNVGLTAARGELVACVDADSYPEKSALLKTVPFFSEPGVAAVTTRIFVRGKNWLAKLQKIEYAMIAWSRKLFEYIDAIYVTPGPLSLYRKDILRDVGGFDENNVTEDIEIAWRLLDRGYKIKMSPASVLTSPPETLKRWWRQRLRWNIGGIQTSLKYKCAMFRSGSFGMFILPFFTLSYALSLLALSLFIYLVYFWAYRTVSFMASAYAAGLNPMKSIAPLWIPDLFAIFGATIFVMSVIMVAIGMREMKHPCGPRSWLFMLAYLSLYITLFPFILVHSIVNFVRGYRGW